MRLRAKRPGVQSKTAARKLWLAGESEKWLNFLPWSDLPQSVCEDETKFVRDWLKNPHTDPWKLYEDCKKVTVPNLDVVGWYDHCNGDMAMFNAIVANGKTRLAREQSKIVIGPWSHPGRGKRG